jgi:hypothetical protein
MAVGDLRHIIIISLYAIATTIKSIGKSIGIGIMIQCEKSIGIGDTFFVGILVLQYFCKYC